MLLLFLIFLIFVLVFSLDAKMRFDDNAEFRQKDLFALRDWSQEDQKEVEAAKHSLNYIALDGNSFIFFSEHGYLTFQFVFNFTNQIIEEKQNHQIITSI